ncbi:hypothetical protein RHMOL_Rhmol13G0216800 [Rhododendron molle]|uniref:Uncharacterized protein n=1 Tax=Rhododendron molle TaxID=49168 RepID=A0ACC0LAJ0_RHOML|nr:hypothetical protein RHMOL_Rhmol13G0216800 [Rhododendron molle]
MRDNSYLNNFEIYTAQRLEVASQRVQENIQSTVEEDLELPLFDLATISTATNNFSYENKIGEGGFGPVYKDRLSIGQEVAVKRLAKTSRQGPKEFKNEVIFISKLHHRNRVRNGSFSFLKALKLKHLSVSVALTATNGAATTDDFRCPVSGELMRDPVVLATRQIYKCLIQGNFCLEYIPIPPSPPPPPLFPEEEEQLGRNPAQNGSCLPFSVVVGHSSVAIVSNHSIVVTVLERSNTGVVSAAVVKPTIAVVTPPSRSTDERRRPWPLPPGPSYMAADRQ